MHEARRRGGGGLVPVDSEHSALYQLVAGEPAGSIAALVLTASGGPFRGRARAELAGVGREEALRHPTWEMGAKITVDSATLMNKGLEVIEAHELFGVPYGAIEVVVHPQSIVHALVRLRDGALLAHLGLPDMRVPIAYALTHPERVDVGAARLDLASVGTLAFEPPDLRRVPLPRAGAPGRRGRRARAVRAERGQRGGRRRLPGRPHRLPRHRRPRRARARGGGARPAAQRAQVAEADAAARSLVREAIAGKLHYPA